jgi:hypothetical protein
MLRKQENPEPLTTFYHFDTCLPVYLPKLWQAGLAI